MVAAAVDDGGISREESYRLAVAIGDDSIRAAVLEGARESKRRGKGDVVSFSRNVFIPLTNLCRDRCSYCTFAKLPSSAEAKTYALEEVDALVEGGVKTGCHEALFCLGDKPEIAYASHREWLRARGYRTTPEYLVDACQRAFEGGILPHSNAGILSQEEMERLRPWNASMGLMLETTSQRLRKRGQPHFYAPDKEPALRLKMHAEAGELKIPFTSGILLGIGENAEERVDTLFAIREIDERYSHIQETIVQPFHPKPGTPMRAESALSDEELAGWIALARLILGPNRNLQAPPNLAPECIERLLGAGLNDWGGVSPVTVDFINPEAPWPTLGELRDRTEASGQRLVERLPVYPEHLLGRPDFFDPALRGAALRFTGEDGYVPRRPNSVGREAAA